MDIAHTLPHRFQKIVNFATYTWPHRFQKIVNFQELCGGLNYKKFLTIRLFLCSVGVPGTAFMGVHLLKNQLGVQPNEVTILGWIFRIPDLKNCLLGFFFFYNSVQFSSRNPLSFQSTIHINDVGVMLICRGLPFFSFFGGGLLNL